MNRTIYFTNIMVRAEELAERLRKDPNKKVALMGWPDVEIINDFNRGEYTDLVTRYVSGFSGFKVDADVIVHHDLPKDHRDDPFVKEVNRRAPKAAVVYRYSDHFEYTLADQVSGA